MDVVAIVARFRSRKFLQWTATYLAAAWLLAQVFGLVGDQFDWPREWQRLITVSLALGVLPAMVLAWFHGERGSQRITAVEVAALVGVMALAAGVTALVARHNPAATPEHASVATLKLDRRHVAVLPLENFGDPANAGFTDGVHDTLITQISHIPGLTVVSRTSVAHWKNQHPTVQQVATALGVGTVLEGSVQRAGDRLRIQVQLIDADSDAHVWSEIYDRPAADVFAVQSEIAQKVAAELQLHLTTAQRGALSTRPTTDAEAYEHFLLGRAHLVSYQQGEAAAEFRAAIERDPGFALAQAELAIALATLANQTREVVSDAWSNAQAASAKALELAPQLPEARLSRALLLYWHDHDYPAAERELRWVTTVLPNEPRPMFFLGLLLRRQGRWEDAAQNFQRAFTLNPRNEGYGEAVFDAAIALRQRDVAQHAIERMRAAMGDLNGQLLDLMQALIALDFDGDARPIAKAAADYYKARPSKSWAGRYAWSALAALGDTQGASRVLAGVDPDDPATDVQLLVPVAAARFAAGDQPAAMAVVEKIRTRASREMRDTPQAREAIWDLYALAFAAALSGDRAAALAAVREADGVLPVAADAIDGVDAWSDMLFVPSLVGDRATTLRLLERVLAVRSSRNTPQSIWCKPWASDLRTDEAFRAIMAAHGVDVTRGPGGGAATSRSARDEKKGPGVAARASASSDDKVA